MRLLRIKALLSAKPKIHFLLEKKNQSTFVKHLDKKHNMIFQKFIYFFSKSNLYILCLFTKFALLEVYKQIQVFLSLLCCNQD